MQPVFRIFEADKFVFDEKTCGGREGDRGDLEHGMRRGASDKQKGNGQKGDDEIDIQAGVVPFCIDEIP